MLLRLCMIILIRIKKCYNHYYCSCYNYGVEHIEFREKIMKIYFNIEYIKFFYLLQK